MLVGFKDTPDDALYRVQTIHRLGSLPFPMRYQRLDANKRNELSDWAEGNGWTHHDLVRFVRYWGNLRITGKIPFSEFRYEYGQKEGA